MHSFSQVLMTDVDVKMDLYQNIVLSGEVLLFFTCYNHDTRRCFVVIHTNNS